MEDLFKVIRELIGDIKKVNDQLTVMRKTQLEIFNESWIDGESVRISLNLSKRTLQTMRDNGTIPFSRINGKFYYKVADLENLLTSKYSKTKNNIYSNGIE